MKSFQKIITNTCMVLVGCSLSYANNSEYAFVYPEETKYHSCEDTSHLFSSKSNQRYQIQTNSAEIKDTVTGLIWQRCSIGQVWDNQQQLCVGKPTVLSWQQALIQTKNLGNGYRLPTINELHSLIDKSCSPALNKRFFPYPARSLAYWSSTPVAQPRILNNTTITSAYVINFNNAQLQEQDVVLNSMSRGIVRAVRQDVQN